MSKFENQLSAVYYNILHFDANTMMNQLKQKDMHMHLYTERKYHLNNEEFF